MVDPTSLTVGKAIHNNNLATLQGSKERSAWVSHMAMAIMASQTVGNAMHSNPSFFKVLPGSKERSAWVSLSEMAIMASQTVGNAMHFQSLNFEVLQF